jgi:hypothetical protein
VSESQKERVKDVLRSAGMNGVCSLFLYDLGIPNGRTRVYELRDKDGLDIETYACDADHEPGTPHHVRFRWTRNRPRQMQLAITA